MSTILVTGGTGSFGNAVVQRYLGKPDVERVIVYSRDEKKQYDMLQQYASPKLTFIIGDTRDRIATMAAMKGVDVVFHAAALKQVPSCEFYPMEAVKTNILGTQNVFDAAEEHGVKKVVLLSTDKAVYPINAMGMSKAMAEKCMVAKARTSTSTIFCAVRYGNVMASRGSVIPLFIGQIKAGKPVTLTVANMTRFLLSLEHAVDLVEYAIAHGSQGDLFIRKAPACTVQALADALIKLFKSEHGIKTIGTRPGEKLHESLATAYELMSGEDCGDYWKIRNILPKGYEGYFSEGSHAQVPEDYTSENTTRLDQAQVEELLLTLPYVRHELGLV